VLFTDDLAYAFTDPVSSLFLAGVASEVEPAEYALTIVSSPRGGDGGAAAKAILDGLIVYSVDDDSPGLAMVRARGFPIVSVDQEPEPTMSAVNVADRRGAASAATHLIELGHTVLAAVAVAAGPGECAFVSVDATSQNFVVRERLAGWRSACRVAGVAPPVTVSCPVNLREHGRHAARLLLSQTPQVTGIVCLSDELALGVMTELSAHTLSVPHDLSVIGFDDSPVAAMASPPLTTVRQPASEKGAAAARILLGLLGDEPPREPIVLETELIVRGSTAARR
jgi:DNA-binding LacI/PurR family transcriptional regulator